MRNFMVAAFTALAIAGPSAAGEAIVRLSVPGMYCASCPFIVRSAIGAVEGVTSVTADIDTRTATVVFDDAVATIAAIAAASASAGYQATVVAADG